MPCKTLCLSLVILASLLFPGCATIMHGSRQGVFLTCEPRIAAVYIDGQYRGHTPMGVVLRRGKNHHLKIELPGYKPFETVITRRLDGWAFGNILGVVGIAVDAFNGSMYRLRTKDMYPELAPLAGQPDGGDNLSIRIVLHADPEWEKIGQISFSK